MFVKRKVLPEPYGP